MEEELNNIEVVDNKILADDVSNKITFSTLRYFLVKPLDPIMVKKEFSTPIASDTTVENGIEATNYNDVATEIKEVESDFKKGIVLKVPYDYEMLTKSDSKFPTKPVSVGDVMYYRRGVNFDVLKNSQLVEPYDVIAIEC